MSAGEVGALRAALRDLLGQHAATVTSDGEVVGCSGKCRWKSPDDDWYGEAHLHHLADVAAAWLEDRLERAEAAVEASRSAEQAAAAPEVQCDPSIEQRGGK